MYGVIERGRQHIIPRPILLEISDKKEEAGRRRRFYYDRCWAERDEFVGLVQDCWFRDDGRDCISRVVNRLASCASQLQLWNRSNRKVLNGNIDRKKKELAFLNVDQIAVEWRRIRMVEGELDDFLKVEEVFWKQRAKVSWMKEGDRNTRFFHAKASARKKRNFLSGLRDDSGVFQTEESVMEGIISEYFSSLFASSQPSRQQTELVLNSVENVLAPNMREELDSPFTAEDVRVVLFQMHPDNSPCYCCEEPGRGWRADCGDELAVDGEPDVTRIGAVDSGVAAAGDGSSSMIAAADEES
ncbi:hypothetical protein LWI29_006742 [Acer saccharum]|uniref:Uncharacterized protein n=1 Tax=Acer saccharum TaxID=4024 RepID=A0AA39VQ93_ACESA|nr:hypothetical protein LWI29_006742 [Acer saccharum]